jgi:hypothetical protein
MTEPEVEVRYAVGSDEPISEASSYSGALGTFVLGAVAGVALALLFAPSSGSETRDAIGDRVHEVAERIRAARRRMMRGTTAAVPNEDFEPGVFAGTPAEAEERPHGGNGGKI